MKDLHSPTETWGLSQLECHIAVPVLLMTTQPGSGKGGKADIDTKQLNCHKALTWERVQKERPQFSIQA